MKTERKMWRQGDILFRAVEALPTGKHKKRENGHILEGEATGHIHRIAETQLLEAEVLECGDGLFLNVTGDGNISIVHEDHKAIELPPGKYEIVRQREYSPEQIRNVCD